jgi:hypothetical protein
MHRQGTLFSRRLAALAALPLLACACAAVEAPAITAEDTAPPTRSSLDVCALPASLDTLEACRSYALCCDPSLAPPPVTCSFARAGGAARCACALGEGHEVRCEESAKGVTCLCA